MIYFGPKDKFCENFYKIGQADYALALGPRNNTTTCHLVSLSYGPFLCSRALEKNVLQYDHNTLSIVVYMVQVRKYK